MQRAKLLIALLVGLTIGLALPKVWPETPAAEAASKSTIAWRCLMDERDGTLVIHNTTASPASVALAIRRFDGSLSSLGTITIDPLGGAVESVPGSGVIEITSASALLVDASTRDMNPNYRQASCFLPTR
jgi:hypothetical protein